MISISRGIAVIALVACCYNASHSQSKQAIVNVTVIDVTGTGITQPAMTIIIEDGKIIRIDPTVDTKISSGVTVIDGQGKFVMPGLWDMHTHLSYFGEEALMLLVGNGVTGVRDMGGDLQQIDSWRREIKNGTRIGPLIFRAGPFVDGKKSMDAQRASFTRVINSEEEGRNVVGELQGLGVDFIKIHSRVPRKAFFAIADEAKKRHLWLMVHAPREVTVSEISDAGARSIEHTESLLGEAIYEKNDAVRDSLTDVAFKKLEGKEGEQIVTKIRKNGNWYDPTLISLYLLKGTDYEKKLGPRLMPIVTKLFRAGIPLLTGSDFAIKRAGIIPGIDLHGELELFVQAGLKPMEAIQAATINAARCLNIQTSVGSLEQGKLANLVLLDANPLHDIRNTRKISAVFLNGKVLSGSALKDAATPD